jgi:hypothetical protein
MEGLVEAKASPEYLKGPVHSSNQGAYIYRVYKYKLGMGLERGQIFSASTQG